MKIDKNTQIPNTPVYVVLFGIVFGVNVWLLVFRNESPTNWILYALTAVAVFAGLVRLALKRRDKHARTS
jgi:hypothetical protein